MFLLWYSAEKWSWQDERKKLSSFENFEFSFIHFLFFGSFLDDRRLHKQNTALMIYSTRPAGIIYFTRAAVSYQLGWIQLRFQETISNNFI